MLSDASLLFGLGLLIGFKRALSLTLRSILAKVLSPGEGYFVVSSRSALNENLLNTIRDSSFINCWFSLNASSFIDKGVLSVTLARSGNVLDCLIIIGHC